MNVAFIGLGRMGEPMAQNLAKAGLLQAVWNRSDGRTGWCGDAGVRVASSAAEAAAGADVVILMLADGHAARAVGADALSAMAAGSVLVDMGTSGPEAERDLARAAAERGIGFLDAPVSGSIAPARAGTLTALVGGSEDDLERARPALEAMTKAQHHLGGVGSGAVMKLALNTLIAVTNEGISELLVLCERAGLERPAAYAALADSALASPFDLFVLIAAFAPIVYLGRVLVVGVDRMSDTVRAAERTQPRLRGVRPEGWTGGSIQSVVRVLPVAVRANRFAIAAASAVLVAVIGLGVATTGIGAASMDQPLGEGGGLTPIEPIESGL